MIRWILQTERVKLPTYYPRVWGVRGVEGRQGKVFVSLSIHFLDFYAVGDFPFSCTNVQNKSGRVPRACGLLAHGGRPPGMQPRGQREDVDAGSFITLNTCCVQCLLNL